MIACVCGGAGFARDSVGAVYVHRDWLVIHPSWGVGRVVLPLLLLLLSSALLVVVPVVSSVVAATASPVVLTEEWAIRCISSSRWRCVHRHISSASIAA